MHVQVYNFWFQYFSTVQSSNALPVWLSNENIDEMTQLDADPVTDMMSSAQPPVGGVITETDPADPGRVVELQRIISRCRCQLFYASYGDVNLSQQSAFPAPVCMNQKMVYRF